MYAPGDVQEKGMCQMCIDADVEMINDLGDSFFSQQWLFLPRLSSSPLMLCSVLLDWTASTHQSSTEESLQELDWAKYQCGKHVRWRTLHIWSSLRVNLVCCLKKLGLDDTPSSWERMSFWLTVSKTSHTALLMLTGALMFCYTMKCLLLKAGIPL